MIAEEPEVCQTANGEWVPYPKGRRNKLAFPVVGYGVDAVSIRPGENEMDCLYNQAKGHYLLRRPQLINHFLGKWWHLDQTASCLLATRRTMCAQ